MHGNAGSSGGSRGLFAVIDGIDGCGKSTQAARLAAALERATGRPTWHLREPGSTALGERLRELVLTRELSLSPAVETLLFAAARRQMLDERVRPARERRENVVCERFHASTYAYQAVAGGLGEERVLALLEDFAGEPKPDITLVLDVAPELAATRRHGARAPLANLDRIEAHGIEFQRRVAEGFRRFAARYKETVVIDARGSADEVFDRIWNEVSRAL
jgi:dTMP kinase